MTRRRVAATVDAGRLAEARELLGIDDVSEVLDTAVDARIERELERRWLTADLDRQLPVDVPVDLSHLPWDDE